MKSRFRISLEKGETQSQGTTQAAFQLWVWRSKDLARLVVTGI